METLPEVRKWSGDPSGGQQLVGRLSRRTKTGRETLPVVQKWLGDPPGGLGLVGIPSWKSVTGR